MVMVMVMMMVMRMMMVMMMMMVGSICRVVCWLMQVAQPEERQAAGSVVLVHAEGR
jgi:hypothetical protein